MPMKGTTVEVVASSWIEALGGLSWKYIFRIPPLFWACAVGASVVPNANAATAPSKAANDRMCRFLLVCSVVFFCGNDGVATRPRRLRYRRVIAIYARSFTWRKPAFLVSCRDARCLGGGPRSRPAALAAATLTHDCAIP